MNRGTIVLMVIGGIALVALIVVALRGTTTETAFAPPELGDVEGACMRDGAPAACVIGKSATDPGGLSIFGTTLFANEVTYRVMVQVQSRRDCVERVYGVERVERWPAPWEGKTRSRRSHEASSDSDRGRWSFLVAHPVV